MSLLDDLLKDELAAVLDPLRSDTDKRLALSVAYHKGIADGLAASDDSAVAVRKRDAIQRSIEAAAQNLLEDLCY